MRKIGLMDIFQAVIVLNCSKYQTLQDLKAMNKKFAFTAVRKGQRKMDQGMESKFINVMTVNDSF